MPWGPSLPAAGVAYVKGEPFSSIGSTMIQLLSMCRSNVESDSKYINVMTARGVDDYFTSNRKERRLLPRL